ncbi:hypothetical protein, partial [Stenotrophomonas maltophilia]|uniref:hypothetical protein n=1 Tax=Stenotrophomonas maltophilia TaxID=40324 RepID=UPI001C65B5BB
DRLVVPAAGRQPHASMVGICRPAAGTTKYDAIGESLWWVPTLVGTVPATSRFHGERLPASGRHYRMPRRTQGWHAPNSDGVGDPDPAQADLIVG